MKFWAGLYQYQQERLYADNIGRPLTRERVIELFVWKNGGRLSAPKMRSVEKNYIKRIDESQHLPDQTSAADFLVRFASGGVIWRIFWLHCWYST